MKVGVLVRTRVCALHRGRGASSRSEFPTSGGHVRFKRTCVFARARTRLSASPKRFSDGLKQRRRFARARAHPPIPPRCVRSSDAPKGRWSARFSEALQRRARHGSFPAKMAVKARGNSRAVRQSLLRLSGQAPASGTTLAHDANRASVARPGGQMVVWIGRDRPARTGPTWASQEAVGNGGGRSARRLDRWHCW